RFSGLSAEWPFPGSINGYLLPGFKAFQALILATDSHP
ncbi:hypothetical protein CLOM_g24397, partial [Closterium sp. NIES-68]